jgi:peptidoglycan/LPS O-acetylase OafA/YrhL
VTRPNIPVLTVMRFLAALLVVIFHYGKKQLLFPLGVSDFGHEAAIFFFVLSGFVLTYAHANVDGEPPLNVSAQSFLLARVGRILPGYLVGLVIAAPFFLYGHFVSHVTGGSQFYAGAVLVPLFLQAWYPPTALAWNAPAWSLSVEWFFYVTYPLAMVVLRAVPPIRLLVVTFLVVLVVGTWRQYLLLHGVEHTDAWVNFYAHFPLFHLPQFMLGVALGLLFLNHKLRPGAHELLFLSGIAGIGMAIVLKPTHAWVANIAPLTMPFCALIYGAAGIPQRIAGIVAPRPLEILGEASYAIYILHVPLGMWWVRFADKVLVVEPFIWADFCSYLLLTLALSVGIFYLVERPSRRWLRCHVPRYARS